MSKKVIRKTEYTGNSRRKKYVHDAIDFVYGRGMAVLNKEWRDLVGYEVFRSLIGLTALISLSIGFNPNNMPVMQLWGIVAGIIMLIGYIVSRYTSQQKEQQYLDSVED